MRICNDNNSDIKDDQIDDDGGGDKEYAAAADSDVHGNHDIPLRRTGRTVRTSMMTVMAT
jgi:hypothetical protein